MYKLIFLIQLTTVNEIQKSKLLKKVFDSFTIYLNALKIALKNSSIVYK